MGVTENIMTGARLKYTFDSGYPFPSQMEQVPMRREYPSPTEHKVTLFVGTEHILGEGPQYSLT